MEEIDNELALQRCEQDRENEQTDFEDPFEGEDILPDEEELINE